MIGGSGAFGRPLTHALRFAQRKEDGGAVFFIAARHLAFIMQRDFGQKKNDWVLIAYIIQRRGGEASTLQLMDDLSAWKKRNKTTRQISGIMASYSKKGFQKEREEYVSVHGRSTFVSIWSFKGDLPEINQRTLQNWERKLSP